MCLSKVYTQEQGERQLLIEEASRIIVDGRNLRVDSLIGEQKLFNDYFIAEVNFMDNYVMLENKKEHD